MKVASVACLVALPTLAVCATLPPAVFPANDWVSPPTEAAIIPREAVERAVAAIGKFTGADGASGVMVIHRGYVLWAGDRVDEKRPVWSCTKSFLSTCLGLLWDDGKCSPDDLASKYLSELAKDYPAVTLRHLATFTSGLHLENYSLDVQAPDYPPGTAMHYSAQSDILACILTKIAGESLRDLFKRRIADPIGMDPDAWEWKTVHTRDGIVINGGAGMPDNGMHTTARNLARFGWLYANGGVWDGKRLISQRYIDASTVAQVPADMPLFDPKGWYYELPGVYGLNWWTNGVRHDGTRLWPHVPARAFAAQGNKNNICIIVPEWRLVVVRTGQDKIIPTSDYDEALAILGQALPR